MADNDPTDVPPPTAEQRQSAAGQFERANQVIAGGNYDYGIQLLLSCCKLDPVNLVYRQTLRRTEKARYKNNLRGSWLAWLTTSAAKARIRTAKRARAYVKVLEHAEDVLVRNPWDIGAQMDMAEAFDALGQLDLAIWALEQAREKDPHLALTNRSLARLYEKRGHFAQAVVLWELVSKADPRDIEANHKAKELAGSEVLPRGQPEQGHGARTPPAAAPPAAAPPAADSSAAPLESGAQDAAPLLARIEADPTQVNGYLDLAALYRRANLFDKARAILQQGLGPTGNHFQLSLELAELDLEPFRRNLAMTETKLAADPHNEQLCRIQAEFSKEINSRELELFRMKADRYPAELAHRLELGIRLLHAGQLDEAIRELQAVRGDSGLGWQASLHLGHCFKQRNNWRQARRQWEDVLQTLPAEEQQRRKETLFLLAEGCADAGELVAAIEKAHDLANLDLSYRDIGRLLDEWQSRLQRA